MRQAQIQCVMIETMEKISHSLYSNQTIASVSHLILAMMYYPLPFQKARDEIARVIGTERLPTFDDRASLPYGMLYILNLKPS